MEYFDRLEINIYDLDKCSICGKDILKGEEIVEILNENQAVYKIDHFLCKFPNGAYP